MMNNAILDADGTFESSYPGPVLKALFPLDKNPILANTDIVNVAAMDIRMRYPNIVQLHLQYIEHDNQQFLLLIASG